MRDAVDSSCVLCGANALCSEWQHLCSDSDKICFALHLRMYMNCMDCPLLCLLNLTQSLLLGRVLGSGGQMSGAHEDYVDKAMSTHFAMLRN